MIERFIREGHGAGQARVGLPVPENQKRGGRRPLELLYVMKGYFQCPVIKVDQGQFDIAWLWSMCLPFRS
jgi:hypothetical protein